MTPRRKKHGHEKDLTRRFLTGELDEDRLDVQQRFSKRSKHHQQNKTLRTATLRADEAVDASDWQSLPVGEVVQVFSLFSEVEHEGRTFLAVVRKTLAKTSDTQLVVGDRVRFRDVTPIAPGRPDGPSSDPPDSEADADQGPREAVIEQILPRSTVLTRADSFKAIEQHPIVANAEQMLIVISLLYPRPKWGLVDRMLVAAEAGGLKPIVCLNKIDVADESAQEWATAEAVLGHYRELGMTTLRTSVERGIGIDEVRRHLLGKVTVLAGHSGVGKSSLINAVKPGLNLRTAAVSGYNEKGRHTTTSARRYVLDGGGQVVDTPGVKLFGLWNVTPENLIDFFPDVADDSAPDWRKESYERILESLRQR